MTVSLIAVIAVSKHMIDCSRIYICNPATRTIPLNVQLNFSISRTGNATTPEALQTYTAIFHAISFIYLRLINNCLEFILRIITLISLTIIL